VKLNNVSQYKLSKVQPSQLFINAQKLSVVLARYNCQDLQKEHFPVLGIGEAYVFTDQHTRAFAALLYGIEDIWIYPDTDDLSIEMYSICVDWCKQENILSIQDLTGRIISNEEYQQRWIARCQQMHNNLQDR